jgi:L-alanine-DL-glutamate epimerase-like enolase superfamily enzyme
VLAHERTTPKASTDRLDLTHNAPTLSGLGPVDGNRPHRAPPGPGELVGRVDVDGVTHLAERVTDPQRIASITELVGSDEVLIADGHHRYAVARAFRDEKGAAGGSG